MGGENHFILENDFVFILSRENLGQQVMNMDECKHP